MCDIELETNLIGLGVERVKLSGRLSVLLCPVLPNRLLVKIDQANDSYKTYQQHLGVLRLTVVTGTGFNVVKQVIEDIPSLYYMTKLGAFQP